MNESDNDGNGKAWLFRPGQSGNPVGRPKGSRSKLGESFLLAMYADFKTHGTKTIEMVRIENPHIYLKIIASILPKELNLNANPLSGMSDEELEETLVILKQVAQHMPSSVSELVDDTGLAPADLRDPASAENVTPRSKTTH